MSTTLPQYPCQCPSASVRRNDHSYRLASHTIACLREQREAPRVVSKPKSKIAQARVDKAKATV